MAAEPGDADALTSSLFAALTAAGGSAAPSAEAQSAALRVLDAHFPELRHFGAGAAVAASPAAESGGDASRSEYYRTAGALFALAASFAAAAEPAHAASALELVRLARGRAAPGHQRSTKRAQRVLCSAHARAARVTRSSPAASAGRCRRPAPWAGPSAWRTSPPRSPRSAQTYAASSPRHKTAGWPTCSSHATTSAKATPSAKRCAAARAACAVSSAALRLSVSESGLRCFPQVNAALPPSRRSDDHDRCLAAALRDEALCAALLPSVAALPASARAALAAAAGCGFNLPQAAQGEAPPAQLAALVAAVGREAALREDTALEAFLLHCVFDVAGASCSEAFTLPIAIEPVFVGFCRAKDRLLKARPYSG